MIYKNHKEVYKQVSENLEVDYETVRCVNDFYWSDISSRVSDFKNREVYITGFGVFRFRKLASEKYIKHIEKIEPFMKRLNRSEEVIEIAKLNAQIKKQKMEVLIAEWVDIVNESRKHREERNANRNIQ